MKSGSEARRGTWEKVRSDRSGIAVDLFLLTLVCCLAMLIANPSGNFPLNDDWSYSMAVKRMLETGDYRPTGWVSMTLMTQVLWGALFSLPWGFSFEVLRASTLIIALLGIFGTYLLTRELIGSRRFAILAALSLAANPVYFEVSATFMTDVPFTSLSIWGSLYFLRSLRDDSNRSLVIAIAIAVTAVLCRQLALFMPLGFAIASIGRNGWSFRSVPRAAAPLVVCGAIFAIFQHWLSTTGRLPSMAHLKDDFIFSLMSNPFRFTKIFLRGLYTVSMYVGLFMLPVIVPMLPRILGIQTARHAWVRCGGLFAAAIALASVLAAVHALMPIGRNVLIESGLGPLTLRDTYVLDLPSVTPLPRSFWFAVTVLSLFGLAAVWIAITRVAWQLIRKLRPGAMDGNDTQLAFMALGMVAYALPVVVAGMYDRYLLITIPLLAASLGLGLRPDLVSRAAKARIGIGFVFVASFAVFAVLGTRDYFTWNRARWTLLNDVVHLQHARPDEVDGGPEFNGWYLYDENYVGSNSKSWWWVKDDDFMVTFQPLVGFTTLREVSWRRWLGSGDGKLFLQERNDRVVNGRQQ